MDDIDSPPFIPPETDDPVTDHAEEIATVQLLQLRTPPRKRARMGREDEEMKSPPKSTEIVRDSDFYMVDGSCVLLVENTLFNVSHISAIMFIRVSLISTQVHRSILSRDSSSFGLMFSISNGDKAVEEGTSDQHPIILAGDKVIEFRNFLWALYALCVNFSYIFSCCYRSYNLHQPT